jgi:hypothetical protein
MRRVPVPVPSIACRVAIGLLALVLAACGSDGPTAVNTNFVLARGRWALRGPATYQLTVARSCFCAPESTKPVVVTVVGGQVVSRRYVDGGADVPAGLASFFPSVDQLFAVIQDARSRDAATIDAEYDVADGHPISVFIDYVAQAADDELRFSVTGFHAN